MKLKVTNVLKDSLTNCKNCEQTFAENFNFCPHCGQQAKDDLTVGVLFYNTIANYFSFDARFLKSFMPLLFMPGYLASKFIEGKRLLYLHPAQLYLFISVIFFFLLSVTIVRNQVETLDNNLKKTFDAAPVVLDSLDLANENINSIMILDSLTLKGNTKETLNTLQNKNTLKDSLGIPKRDKEQAQTFDLGFKLKRIDSLVAKNAPNEEIYRAMGMDEDAGFLERKFYTQFLKFYKERNGGQILQAAYDTIPISLFILLPIFALILKLLFLKRGNYAHHLVFSFYYFSFLFSIFSLILIANNFIDIPDVIDWFIVLTTFVYLLIAIKKFYGQGWFLSFVKTSLTTFIYMTFVIPIAVVFLFIISFLSY